MQRLARYGKAVFLVLAPVLLLSGCVALVVGAAAGVGGYAYVKGELVRVYDVPYEKAWTASLDTLKSLDMTIVDESRDKLKGIISAKRADDASIKVTVESLSEQSTRVKVRVGVFGDRSASERIHEEIAARL